MPDPKSPEPGPGDLEARRDPERANAAEIEAEEAAEAMSEGDEGPIEGLQQGRTNTNREFEDPSDDVQGQITVQANRDRFRGDL